ncbi:hypothetical protein DFA_08570 [Cavenderia fasciculata]|uniref:Uncharacterized protein n=1 Tax=Cavenderia fasciculata TaxID=261658 RepID=F4Q310_CACFS|nr:uncharacterized protein DFA_08570 [Cavenderia fasciculata]EGG17574.1 hypothetical protein DFA_08570 [Cavenderia fasciculata]|eukprot:XP_004356058.1 hypothetical protein DFA_08570 [Cavenderia fasciculata]
MITHVINQNSDSTNPLTLCDDDDDIYRTGSIKGSILGNKDQQQQTPTTTTTTTTTAAAATDTNNVQSTNNNNNNNNASPTITPATTTPATSSPNSLYSNLQPVVDVIKENVVQPVTDVLKMTVVDVETLKEFTEKDITVALQNMTTSVTNSVASSSSANLPSISQLKESLQDVDLYNGSLLLRTYEIKLKQIRTNGVILAERAEELDKRIFPLVKTCTVQAESWKKAQSELTKLDDMNNMVESITLTLDSLVSKIEALEISLSIDVENYIDNQHQKWKEQKELEFNRYEASKKAELIKLEEDLINAYNRHEREKAAKERAIQLEQERLARRKLDEELQRKVKEEASLRSNLDKTIQKQLNDYKTSGVIPTTSSSSIGGTTAPATDSNQPTTTIEQIVPEDSSSDLENFLAPTPPTTSPTLTSQQPAVISTTDNLTLTPSSESTKEQQQVVVEEKVEEPVQKDNEQVEEKKEEEEPVQKEEEKKEE